MSIIVNLDVMMARRKMSSQELAEKIGLSAANLSILKTGKAKAIRCHVGGIILYRQDRNTEYTAVGRDQGKIYAQALVKGRDITLQGDLDQLYQYSDDENKNDRLHIAKAIGIQKEHLKREGNRRSDKHYCNYRQAHTNTGIQLFRYAQEGADTKELYQHIVIYQNHAEEDRCKGCHM